MKNKPNTSWNKVAEWYNESVGERGQYYHEHVIIPGVVRMLGLSASSSLFDAGCGQGVLGRAIGTCHEYVGVDIAPDLIRFARKKDTYSNHRYIVGDVTTSLPTVQEDHFSHAVCILALQNIDDSESVIKNIARYLAPGGKLVLVINHPCFRIPRQSGWEIDQKNKLQYRRVNRYMSPLRIPVSMHPGQAHSPTTWSFHRPLSDYMRELTDNGFLIARLEEWVSDKESVGKARNMENRARREFPLFLAIGAVRGD